MNIKTLIILALGVLVFMACDQSATKGAKKAAAQNIAQPGSKTEKGKEGRTATGYKYVHHIKNNTKRATVGDRVKYHKIIYKNDTTLLQSTYMLLEPRADVLRPRDSVANPPPPTYDALFLMSPGDSMTLYQYLDTFPPEKLPKGITNKDYFTYHVKVLDIEPRSEVERKLKATKQRHFTVTDSLRAFIKDFKAGKLDQQIVSTGTGLRYVNLKEGTGKQVKDGGFVKVHYMGMLEDGTLFDGTFASAKPFPTRIGRNRVIAGWDEGIPLMKQGGETLFIVPYQLAYGIAGKPPAIPQRADLYFFVSLVGVY